MPSLPIMAMNLPTVWRFGAIEVDEGAAEVRAAGVPSRLDRNSYAVLLALLRAGGAPVGKDELLQAGWPGRIVHENSLAKAVGRIRQALGIDGAALETVHGYGYRLLQAAPVERPTPAPSPTEAEAETVPSPPAPAVTAAPVRGPRRLLPWLALATVMVLAALFAFLHTSSSLVARSAKSPPLQYSEPADAIGRILWVDDNPGNNEVYREWFLAHKIGVYSATNSTDALSLLSLEHYTVVISDMGRDRGRRPLAGLKLLQAMRSRGDQTPFYIFTIRVSDGMRRLVDENGGQGAVDDPKDLYAQILPLFEPKKTAAAR